MMSVASPPDPPATTLPRAVAHLLRPLVRLLLLRGLAYPAAADLLREVYLDVARRDVLTDPRARTDSRISLLTGIHRKEVRRSREAPVARGPAESRSVSLSSQIVATWLSGPPWTDTEGVPLPLPRAAEQGAAAGVATFDALVATVTRDVRPRAVLDEWLHQGIVHLDAENRAVLAAAAYLPPPGGPAQLFYFARNLHDHIAAAAGNVAATGRAPFLDRSVHYDGLSPAAAAELEAVARRAAERLLIEVNRTAMRLADATPPAHGAPTRRVNLGAFVYTEPDTIESGDVP